MDALTTSLLSIVFGAIAGAIVTELRERWRDNRHKEQIRNGLLLAFKAQISKDMELLTDILDPKSYVSPDDISPCLYPALWKERQIDVYQYLPEIAPVFIEYFVPLTLLASQFSWTTSPRELSVPRWTTDDVSKQIRLAQQALSAIDQALITIPKQAAYPRANVTAGKDAKTSQRDI